MNEQSNFYIRNHGLRLLVLRAFERMFQYEKSINKQKCRQYYLDNAL